MNGSVARRVGPAEQHRGQAVARAAQPDARGDAVERHDADPRRRACRTARPRPARRRDDVGASRRAGRSVRSHAGCSARRCSTSGSSPGSGTCGSPSCSGTRGSRRGCRSGQSRRRGSRAGARWGRDAMRRAVRRCAAPPRRLPPGGPRLSALRYRRSARAASASGTARPTGAPAASSRARRRRARARTRNRAGRRVPGIMAVRSPQLHHALRGFTLGAFAYLLRELDDAGEALPFAFEEHGGRDGPALYEYRPLVRDFVEARADRLRGRDDATIALEELAPRAGGRDLRARPRRPRAVGGRRAVPHRARRPAGSRRRSLRRIRLGRRVVRPGVRRARALALR